MSESIKVAGFFFKEQVSVNLQEFSPPIEERLLLLPAPAYVV